MEGNSISRERMIQAGIEAMEADGAEGFSLRQVAQRCGVSCAAPYKHFKDKQALMRAIARQYNDQWHARQLSLIEGSEGDLTELLQQICKAYLRFLMENPTFCVLATQMDAASSQWHLRSLLGGASPTNALLQEYSRVHDIAPRVVQVKISLLRGQLFGVAMMVGAGELELDEETMEIVYRELNSAFLS